MIIAILGPQGSGKGTQAQMLAERLNLYYFDMGNFLRDIAKNDSKIDEFVNKRGALVPEDVSSPLAFAFLDKEKLEHDNILLDGFPRSMTQLRYVDEWLSKSDKKIDNAVFIDVSEEVSIKRLSARRICDKCGTIYNLITNPPPATGCPCGGKLYQREDDRPEAIKERLSWYKGLSEPLINEYEKRGILIKVDGERPIKTIFEDIMKKLEVK